MRRMRRQRIRSRSLGRRQAHSELQDAARVKGTTRHRLLRIRLHRLRRSFVARKPSPQNRDFALRPELIRKARKEGRHKRWLPSSLSLAFPRGMRLVVTQIPGGETACAVTSRPLLRSAAIPRRSEEQSPFQSLRIENEGLPMWPNETCAIAAYGFVQRIS